MKLYKFLSLFAPLLVLALTLSACAQTEMGKELSAQSDQMVSMKTLITRNETKIKILNERLTEVNDRVVAMQQQLGSLSKVLSKRTTTKKWNKPVSTPQPTPQPEKENIPSTPPKPAEDAAAAPVEAVTKAPMAKEDEPKPTPQPPETDQKTYTPGLNVVQEMRIGQHDEKTRLVLDLSKGSNLLYSAYAETDELMILELPKTAWDAKTEITLKDNPLIKRLEAHTDKETTYLNIYTAGIEMGVWVFDIPEKGPKNPRIVLDFSLADDE